jgi:hypothetical protein
MAGCDVPQDPDGTLFTRRADRSDGHGIGLALAVGPTIIGHGSMNYAVKYISPTILATLILSEAVVAAVAGPAWFERDKEGFVDPALDPSILGMLTIILIPVQILLIAFAMRGFQQQWNVEVEVTRDEAERYRRGDREPGQVQPA